uniref:Reverse transcriptase domain-containing protein n=1 Tax=Heterorhabditis bacteriophora TaxID=37862 RepID=A0A1I7WEI7_HETBA
MNELAKGIRARVFIYIDDLVITSDTADEHLQDVDEVLGKIEGIGMKLKASKCLFAQPEVKFLGFVLSEKGIRPNPDKTFAIDNYPTPKDLNEVRAFIGMTSFFRRFIPKYAQVAAPLTDLTKKDTPFLWSEKCEEAFQNLKRAITTLGKPYVIETDASGLGVGAGEGHQEKVIAYASRTLNKHESRYPAIELEALGIIVALQKFKPYIDGAKCTIITDHSPLKKASTISSSKRNVVADDRPRALKEKINNAKDYHYEDYRIIGDILYRIPERRSKNLQIVLPEQSKFKTTIIKNIHELSPSLVTP